MKRPDLTKEDLINMNIDIVGLDIYHTTKRNGLTKLSPKLNTQYHNKGIIGKCQYYMVGWCHEGKLHSYPYHRVLYAWYNGIAHSGMDIMHLDGNSLNNNIMNLKEGTRKENLAMRKGAKNQYCNIWYYYNTTCGDVKEKCYYDANKYYSPNGYPVNNQDKEFNSNNVLGLPDAFGNELYIEVDCD